MSKSKGNVVDPLKLTSQYGVDALRAALVFETTPGADLNISDDKVRGMRNFINKIWNIARFLYPAPASQTPDIPSHEPNTHTMSDEAIAESLARLMGELSALQQSYNKNMDAFEFSAAFVSLHEFVWHRFADVYIEELKQPIRTHNDEVKKKMQEIFQSCLEMLEPFIPYVVTAIHMQSEVAG